VSPAEPAAAAPEDSPKRTAPPDTSALPEPPKTAPNRPPTDAPSEATDAPKEGALAAVIAQGKIKGTAQDLLTEGEHWTGVSAGQARASQQKAAATARPAPASAATDARVRWTVPYPAVDVASPAHSKLAQQLSLRRSNVRSCYERAVSEPVATDHVVIANFTLTPRGEVADIAIDQRSSAPPAAQQCVVNVLRRMRIADAAAEPLRTAVAATFEGNRD
jgi:hypothetical protein